MTWLVILCFVIFGIGIIGFMINIFKGKNPWQQTFNNSPDASKWEDSNDNNPSSGNN